MTDDAFDWDNSPLFIGPEGGARVLDDLRAAICDYVVLPTMAALDAVTLWIAATHAQAEWNCATRLVIKAPEKRCGKSRLLDIIEATCHNPLITVNISPAALVRSIGTEPPTLLLDESDAVFGKKAADNHEDLRGILNAGHQRNRPYIRWDAAARSSESCPTFAMAALAGIGDMPETIEDRAVVVSMRRRSAGETVLPYRVRRDSPRLHKLGERLAVWTASVAETLRAAEPAMPIEDRAADNWEPLIAVADAAGGTWPERARSAALVLVHASEQHDTERSTGLRLLADIRAVTEGEVFVSSADLLARLFALEESPWRDYGITTRQLAAKLKPYGVSAGHDTTKKHRGYKLAAFADAWARYLSPTTDPLRPEASERPKPPETLTDTTDAHEATDDHKRPVDTQASVDTPQDHWPSDARTDTDDTPAQLGVLTSEYPANDLGRQDSRSGNPHCQMCGKPNLFHPDSIARGICASCSRVLEQAAS